MKTKKEIIEDDIEAIKRKRLYEEREIERINEEIAELEKRRESYLVALNESDIKLEIAETNLRDLDAEEFYLKSFKIESPAGSLFTSKILVFENKRPANIPNIPASDPKAETGRVFCHFCGGENGFHWNLRCPYMAVLTPDNLTPVLPPCENCGKEDGEHYFNCPTGAKIAEEDFNARITPPAYGDEKQKAIPMFCAGCGQAKGTFNNSCPYQTNHIDKAG